SIAIAQTQTEHDRSPAMTTCTTKLACQARSNSETPELIAGSDAPSGIGKIPSTQCVPNPPEQVAAGSHGPPVRRRREACTKEPGLVAGEARRSLGLHSPVNMSKRGLFARLYAPNQTLIRVKTRLPKGNPDGGNGGLPSPWVSPGMRYFGLKT